MKKLICLILGVIFMILGFIGLLLPIIPQIPFFIAGIILLSFGSENIRKIINENHYYQKYLKDTIDNNKTLQKIIKRLSDEG